MLQTSGDPGRGPRRPTLPYALHRPGKGVRRDLLANAGHPRRAPQGSAGRSSRLASRPGKDPEHLPRILRGCSKEERDAKSGIYTPQPGEPPPARASDRDLTPRAHPPTVSAMGTCSSCGLWSSLQHIRLVVHGVTRLVSACALCIGLLVAQAQPPVPPQPTPIVMTWPGTPGILSSRTFLGP